MVPEAGGGTLRGVPRDAAHVRPRERLASRRLSWVPAPPGLMRSSERLNQFDHLACVLLRAAPELRQLTELNLAVGDSLRAVKCVEVLHPADVAGAVVAIADGLVTGRGEPLAAEVALRHAAVDVVPGK